MHSKPPSPLVRALRHYVHARNAALIQARQALKIGELDARAMLFIHDNPGTRPTQLRGHLGITSAGVTTLIDRLVDRGAVRRDVDTADRRVNRISITVDLEAEPWSALTRFDREFEKAVATDSDERHEHLAAALERLTRATSSIAA